MTRHITTTAAARSTTSPVRAPLRQRAGAAVASAVVTCFVFGGIALGMAGDGDAGPALVAHAHAIARA